MKTTIVILMTFAINTKVGSLTDPRAENEFFSEFNGIYDEAEENFATDTLHELSLDDDEWTHLNRNLLSGRYAGDDTYGAYAILCPPILDQTATDIHQSSRKVENLCVTCTHYGAQAICYRRSGRDSNLVYAFTYKKELMNCNVCPDRNWPLMVIDLVRLPYRHIA